MHIWFFFNTRTAKDVRHVTELG